MTTKILFHFESKELRIYQEVGDEYLLYKYRGSEVLDDYLDDVDEIKERLKDEFHSDEYRYSFVYDELSTNCMRKVLVEFKSEICSILSLADFEKINGSFLIGNVHNYK